MASDGNVNRKYTVTWLSGHVQTRYRSHRRKLSVMSFSHLVKVTPSNRLAPNFIHPENAKTKVLRIK